MRKLRRELGSIAASFADGGGGDGGQVHTAGGCEGVEGRERARAHISWLQHAATAFATRLCLLCMRAKRCSHALSPSARSFPFALDWQSREAGPSVRNLGLAVSEANANAAPSQDGEGAIHA